MSGMRCEVCAGEMRGCIDAWTYYCPACSFWASTFQPDPAALQHDAQVAAAAHEAAFLALRRANGRRILDLLEKLRPLAGARLCDVGCAYGVFLQLAQERGARVSGIEVKTEFAEAGRRAGLDVRQGRFPDCLTAADAFDVITFNDVLEHIPQPGRVLEQCRSRLAPGGLLVVNGPSADGIFFGLSRALCKAGIREPYIRMWQRRFWSPHVSYFNARTLARLARQSGFELKHSGPLPTLELRGLWQRLRCGAGFSLPYTAGVLAGTLCLYPLLPLLPSDILLQIFELR